MKKSYFFSTAATLEIFLIASNLSFLKSSKILSVTASTFSSALELSANNSSIAAFLES